MAILNTQDREALKTEIVKAVKAAWGEDRTGIQLRVIITVKAYTTFTILTSTVRAMNRRPELIKATREVAKTLVDAGKLTGYWIVGTF